MSSSNRQDEFDNQDAFLDGIPQRPMLLVVDDQPANIQIVYEILKADYEICMAMSGQEALAFCRTQLPDLILLDVLMPEMDGYDVCRQLKADELTRDIPVIFVTAHDDPAEEVQGLDEGAVDFISKPLHAKVVQARVRTHLTLKIQSEQLRALVRLDGLTGVANRRHFDETLLAEWRHAVRTETALSLILIDIDHFKRYNDHYGHQAGDACIKAVAATLKAHLHRSHDFVARYGGEEFVCILPETPMEGVRNKAAELEQAVRALRIPHEKSDTADVVTVSLGAATISPARGEDPAGLVLAADQLLYKAKAAGRGQVQAALLH